MTSTKNAEEAKKPEISGDVKADNSDSETTASEREVLVQGTEQLDEDVLKLLFANKKRSGGGKIQKMELSKDCTTALITFQRKQGRNMRVIPSVTSVALFSYLFKSYQYLSLVSIIFGVILDADDVVARQQIEYMNSTFKVSAPLSKVDRRTFKLYNVPPDMSPDMLELILEGHNGGCLSSNVSMRIDNTCREATVTFDDVNGIL